MEKKYFFKMRSSFLSQYFPCHICLSLLNIRVFITLYSVESSKLRKINLPSLHIVHHQSKHSGVCFVLTVMHELRSTFSLYALNVGMAVSETISKQLNISQYKKLAWKHFFGLFISEYPHLVTFNALSSYWWLPTVEQFCFLQLCNGFRGQLFFWKSCIVHLCLCWVCALLCWYWGLLAQVALQCSTQGTVQAQQADL